MLNKNHVRLMMILGFLTALSVSASPMVPGKVAVPYALQNAFKPKLNSVDSVDFNQANTLFQAMVDQILTTENQVEWAMPKFDPVLSSVKNERIVYTLAGGLKNTPWTSATKTLMTTTADLSVDRTSWITGINVVGESKLTTEVFNFINYAANVAKTNVRQHDPVYTNRINDSFDRAAHVQNVADLYQQLIDGQKLTVEFITHQVKLDQDQLECIYNLTCGNPIVDQWGNRTYNSAESLAVEFSRSRWLKMRASYESIQISYANDVITVYAPAPQGLFRSSSRNVPEAKTATVTLSATDIDVKTRFFMAIDVKDLDLRHETMSNDLDAFNHNDPTITEHLNHEFRDALRGFKKVLNGEIRNASTSSGPIFQSPSNPVPQN